MLADFFRKLQPESERAQKILRWTGYIALILPNRATDTEGFLPLGTVVLCAVYALFALGLNIVVGFAGLLDLGYVAFFLVGAYVGAWLMSDFAVNVSKGLRRINIHFLDAASHKIP